MDENKNSPQEEWLDDLQAAAEATLERTRAQIDACKRLILSLKKDIEAIGAPS